MTTRTTAAVGGQPTPTTTAPTTTLNMQSPWHDNNSISHHGAAMTTRAMVVSHTKYTNGYSTTVINHADNNSSCNHDGATMMASAAMAWSWQRGRWRSPNNRCCHHDGGGDLDANDNTNNMDANDDMDANNNTDTDNTDTNDDTDTDDDTDANDDVEFCAAPKRAQVFTITLTPL
ncbi:hypothetical protein EDB89DRAFT_2069151 [Lactarius sanguifluus]|nr:hypothetical protein EDB89DRAFT_2069151 [Lactarius sanguifluus]